MAKIVKIFSVLIIFVIINITNGQEAKDNGALQQPPNSASATEKETDEDWPQGKPKLEVTEIGDDYVQFKLTADQWFESLWVNEIEFEYKKQVNGENVTGLTLNKNLTVVYSDYKSIEEDSKFTETITISGLDVGEKYFFSFSLRNEKDMTGTASDWAEVQLKVPNLQLEHRVSGDSLVIEWSPKKPFAYESFTLTLEKVGSSCKYSVTMDACYGTIHTVNNVAKDGEYKIKLVGRKGELESPVAESSFDGKKDVKSP